MNHSEKIISILKRSNRFGEDFPEVGIKTIYQVDHNDNFVVVYQLEFPWSKEIRVAFVKLYGAKAIREGDVKWDYLTIQIPK